MATFSNADSDVDLASGSGLSLLITPNAGVLVVAGVINAAVSDTLTCELDGVGMTQLLNVDLGAGLQSSNYKLGIWMKETTGAGAGVVAPLNNAATASGLCGAWVFTGDTTVSVPDYSTFIETTGTQTTPEDAVIPDTGTVPDEYAVYLCAGYSNNAGVTVSLSTPTDLTSVATITDTSGSARARVRAYTQTANFAASKSVTMSTTADPKNVSELIGVRVDLSFGAAAPANVNPDSVDRQVNYSRVRARSRALPYYLDTGLLKGLGSGRPTAP